jgi:hypothetical protein
MNTAVRQLLTDLIRGMNLSTAEIDDHICRLSRNGVRLPDGWKAWPSELRSMEREGLIKQEGEGWWVVPAAPKAKQEQLF